MPYATLPFLPVREIEAWVGTTASPWAAPAPREALPSQFPVSSCPNWANWLLLSVRPAAKMPCQLFVPYCCPS